MISCVVETECEMVLKKVILKQLENHMKRNNLHETFQSAYRVKHSTETALLKVNSDILASSDSGKITLLVLLDLSSAFDTIDHTILINRLKTTYGITGSALNWFISYIDNRSQTVKVDSHQSPPSSLDFGVPQGSVLGPVLFSMYSKPVTRLFSQYNFNYHLYADDTQLYKSFDFIEINTVTNDLKNCLHEVASWMSGNKLKLNEEKTEIMVIGTPLRTNSVNLNSLVIFDQNLNLSESFRNLGIIMDKNLTLDKHISNIRKVCYLELRKIAQIRHYLTPEITNKLVCSFVLSKLDYCNSILTSIPETKLKQLQQIQNNAARLVTRTSKRAPITPILKQLHWLPVSARINYKIASIVFQCLYVPEFPTYLKTLINQYIPSRNLRSSSKNLLVKPNFKLNNYGRRSFQYQSAYVWNSLPNELKSSMSLKSFKCHLKTHLFQLYFVE